MKIALNAPSSAGHANQSASTAASAPAKKGRKKNAPGAIKKPNVFSASDNIHNIDRDTVMINGIEIDIEKITDEQLYSLRKILPRKDYRYQPIQNIIL